MNLIPACRRLGVVLSLILAPAAPAGAHPHVFIDAGAQLIFSADGRLTAVRVSWAYDEFYSLMMIEDGGLDQNGDGLPDPDRLRDFAGQDVDWAAGFPGHLMLEQDGKAIGLGPPRDHVARFSDGRIITEHTRPLTAPVKVTRAHPVGLKIYDPEYFVAYDTPHDPTLSGRKDCSVTRRRPDTSNQSELLAALRELDFQQNSLDVMQMPDVGVTFAEGFEVGCGAR